MTCVVSGILLHVSIFNLRILANEKRHILFFLLKLFLLQEVFTQITLFL